MSYKLDKPYTYEQYADFIIEHQGLELQETDTAVYLLEPNEQWNEQTQLPEINPNYEQEQAEKEAERIAKLNLTRGDVLRGLLLAKGVTKEQISNMIEAMPTTTQEEIVAKELAKIDFEDALNFYRGVPLIDTIGTALGITKEQLDKFFETGDYKELM